MLLFLFDAAAQDFYAKGMFFYPIPTQKLDWQINSGNMQFGFEYKKDKNAVFMHYTTIFSGIPDYLNNYKVGYNYYLGVKPTAYYINTALDFEETSVNGYGKSAAYHRLKANALGVNMGIGKKWLVVKNIGIEINLGIFPKIKDKQISKTEYFRTPNDNYSVESVFNSNLYFTLTPYFNIMFIHRTALSKK